MCDLIFYYKKLSANLVFLFQNGKWPENGDNRKSYDSIVRENEDFVKYYKVGSFNISFSFELTCI